MSKEILQFYRTDCKIPETRIAYIPLGIDVSFFRPPTEAERVNARKTLAVSDDTLVCILPGRLNFDKGHDTVIDAIRMLRSRNPQQKIVCLFPGGGDQAETIKAYAFRDDADRDVFRFLGFLNAIAFRDTFWASDVGLLPSRFEGFGLAIAEAMSCGCVPVRTPSGGCDDQIMDGINGFVIPFNDAEVLADRISDISDFGKRAQMRESALTFAAQHFDQRLMIDSTTKLYEAAATH